MNERERQMRNQQLNENLAKLSPEEIDRAAGLLVAPLAQSFRHYIEWIAKSKSDPVAVNYSYQIVTDKRFKSSAKRQQFLSLLKDRIVSHLSNLFASENVNNVKYAIEYAIKFANIAGPQDVAAYIDVLAKNLSKIETALYSVMHDTMGDKTIGASRQYNEVTDMLTDMKQLGFADIELKLRSKYKSERIMTTPPTKRSTWGYYQLYDILDTMASGNDTVVNRLEHLSSESLARVLELKDYFLYREGYITDGRMTEFVKTIIDVKYPAMKRFGLSWPELDFKYSSTVDMLEFYKKPIIKMLLKSLQGANKINIPMTIADLRKSGVNWLELERIEQAMSRKSITEDIDKDDEELYYEAIGLMMELHDELKGGYFANAVSTLDELGSLYQEEGVYLPNARAMILDRQTSRKIDGIYGLLSDISKNGRREMLRAILHIPSGIQISNLITVLDDFGVEWPELDRIDNAIQAGAFDRTPITEGLYTDFIKFQINNRIRRKPNVSKLTGNPLSDKDAIDMVRHNPSKIASITNHSEQVQLVAVQQNGYVIKYIRNPSPEVQLAAVQQDGYTIQHINTPSLQVQLAAVQQNGYAIRFIKTPSLQVQLAAVQQDSGAIGYISNPSLQVQLAAVQENGGAIRNIKTPDPALFVDEQVKRSVLTALLKGLKAGHDISDQISFLRTHQVNWPELAKIEAVLERGKLTESVDINSMSEKDQISEIKKYPAVFSVIKTPSTEVQIGALMIAPYLITYHTKFNTEIFDNNSLKNKLIRYMLELLHKDKSDDLADTLRVLDMKQVVWPESQTVKAAMYRTPITESRKRINKRNY